IVQMPPGIPVATVAVGDMGARNAGHLAAEILAVAEPQYEEAIRAQRAKMREGVQLPQGFSPAG
ncbi:MAG TPA: AIR carboxylase family protein, partial [Dehalococcoidia bacterium]|nr:AIR carboxylase family protein [Dehalococcoidia bacterium]